MSVLPALDAVPVLDRESVHRTVLPNGLTVLLRRERAAPVVAIVTHVRAGYFDETDDIVGIAHVLEHMFFKGTERRGVGDIAKETKASGGYLNAGTIYDHTSYYTVLPASGLEAGLDIQADAYADSVIDAEELRKELEVIIQEAKRKADNPSAVAIETLYEVLHDRHRIRRWRIGREPELRALRREQLVRFYRGFYRPSSTILSVVGDLDPEPTLALIEARYGALTGGAVQRTPGPAEPDRSGFRQRELSGDIAQTQLAIGWRTPGSLHPDTPFLDLCGAVLGTGRASRLYRAVREHSLAAHITAYNYTPTELGVFTIHAEAPPERAADALRAAGAQVRELRDCGVGAYELERARRIFEARWIRRFETMEGQANYLAEWEALGHWTLGERYAERVMSATPEQVTAVARRYLAPDRAGVVVYRPRHAAPLADSGSLRGWLDEGRPEALAPAPPRAASAPPGGAEGVPLEREEHGVRIYRTAGGVPVLVRQRSGAPLAHVGVFALGGASDEPASMAGLTSLLARSMVKGTHRRTATQIAEDAELLGGSIGVSVGAEHLGWTLSVPSRHAAAALDLLGDVVQHPTIPADVLETERAVAIADVRLARDDMYRHPMRLAVQAAFAGHPYGVPASGTEESLAAVTVEAVRDWHRERVLSANLVIAIVGDVEPDAAAAAAARDFAQLRWTEAAPLAAPEWPAALVQAVETREKAQTALALAFPGPRRRDDSLVAAHLLAGIASGLGGRFFDELRDRRSLAYTVHASASERRLAGLFVSYIATSPEREEEARLGLLAEFARLREEPVTAEELERAKRYEIGTHAIRQQSGGAVLGELVDAWLMGRGLRELVEHEARVAAVTAAEIQALAQRYFIDERRVEGIVRGRPASGAAPAG